MDLRSQGSVRDREIVLEILYTIVPVRNFGRTHVRCLLLPNLQLWWLETQSRLCGCAYLCGRSVLLVRKTSPEYAENSEACFWRPRCLVHSARSDFLGSRNSALGSIKGIIPALACGALGLALESVVGPDDPAPAPEPVTSAPGGLWAYPFRWTKRNLAVC